MGRHRSGTTIQDACRVHRLRSGKPAAKIRNQGISVAMSIVGPLERVLSLSPMTVLPCSPLEQIHAASEAGFDAIGLRLQPALETDIDIMADASLQREIERRLSKRN